MAVKAFGDWRLDRDKWLVRRSRPTDQDLIRHWNAGFVCYGRTFVRSLGVAEALDAGRPATASMINDRHGSTL